MILVLAEHNTPRLQYILSELLERRLGIPFRITTDAAAFSASEHLRVNYTPYAHKAGIRVVPQGLLFQPVIRTTVPVAEQHPDWHTILWPSDGDIPFDLFSAAFYLLSRYEEYTGAGRDPHGRYQAAGSTAFRNGFLHLPLVDLWAEQLKRVLLMHRPGLVFRQHTFVQLSTIDVDFAYLYKGIGLRRWAGKLGRALLHLRFNEALMQLAVTAGLRKDPYDTFDHIRSATACNLAYFILTSHSGEYDKAARPRTLKRLTSRLKPHALFIGIHPSYRSATRHGLVRKETRLLEQLTGMPVLHSRQHFLRLDLGRSYRLLTEAGIRHDYTMLYAEQAGFRASTCHPFAFYDLMREEATPLTIHSTCAMDVTLQNYLGLSAEEALKLLLQLRDTTRIYGGTFITLWHNNSLSAAHQPEEWRNVYSSISGANHREP